MASCTPVSVERIAQAKLFELARQTRDRGLKVAFTPAVGKWVAQKGFSPDYGARELRRVIQREIEPRLSAFLLAAESARDGLVRARITRGELKLELEP